MRGLELFTVLFGAGAFLTTLWNTFIKLRARHKLSNTVRENAETTTQVSGHLNKAKVTKADVDAAENVIRDQIARSNLTNTERKAAEEALRQPTVVGRANYIRELAGGGQQADGNAADA